MTEARFSPVAGRYRPEPGVSHNRLKGNGHRRGYQPQGRRVRAKKTVSERSRCRLRRPCCPSVRVGAKLRAWRDAEAPSVSGNDHSLVPCGVGIRRSAAASCPAPRSAGTAFPRHRGLRRTAFIAPVAFATTTRRASMGVPRSFPFVPGIYQRQSIVVDLGATAPRGHRLGTLLQNCRRRALPATSIRPTSFAPQRTHASDTFRLQGFEWSRCTQHRACLFAGP